MFQAALRHVDDLYTTKYDARYRRIPAHYPYFVQKALMQAAQDAFPVEWAITSSHRFRHPQDMQFYFSYLFYHIHHHYSYKLSDPSSIILYKHTGSPNARSELRDIWSTANVKMVGINDDRSTAYTTESELKATQEITSFLQLHYPIPSEFELSESMTTNCTHWLQSEFGKIPHVEEITDLCFVMQPESIL